jgi:hypothetical protein
MNKWHAGKFTCMMYEWLMNIDAVHKTMNGNLTLDKSNGIMRGR